MTDQKPRERLREYIERERLGQKDFSASIGVSKNHLSAIICGRRNPSLQVAMRIEDATKRHVRARSWLNADGEQ